LARFEQPSYENDYTAESSEATRDTPQNAMARSTSISGKEDNSAGTKESSISNKDPEELRQKVLESLAEKKKKAAEFMNMEKEGASIHKDQPNDSKASTSNTGQGGNGETGNPERDAAVDALLATFGSKEENGPSADTVVSRKNSETDVTSGVLSHISPGTSDAQQLKHEQYKYDDTSARPPSRGERHRGPRCASDYSIRQDDHERYRDGHRSSRNPSLSSSRHEQRSEVRKPSDYDEKERRARPEPRYRYDRYEDSNYPKDFKPRSGPSSPSGRKAVNDSRYPPAADERRDPRYNDYYRGPEVARVDHPKDAYGAMKPPRYPAEPPLQDVEYNTINRDYPPYPPPSRYATPREDPRYPQPVPRPPEADYAALYYRDLTEWLDITGYHDYSYRQMHLQRHREARALEESSRYALEHDPAYAPRAPREDSDLRRPHGSSMYSMPPPPLASGAWDEREAAKRPLPGGAPARPGYTLPEERSRDSYRGDDLPGNSGSLKRRPRDDEFAEPPHSAKSARHNYDSHRKPSSYGADSGSMPRNVRGDDPADETEAVRLALSQRIASARVRDASPGASGDRSRRRSLSPQRPTFDKREFSKGRKSPGPSPRFEGRGRGTSKFPPRDDFRKPFPRPRRNSLGELTSPHDRKPFGRGRGRGYSKDYPPYDRNDHYDRRNNIGDLMDMDRISGFPGGELHSHTQLDPAQKNKQTMDAYPYNLPEPMRNSDTRYFMIKSFNQDNVKMAQQDVMKFPGI